MTQDTRERLILAAERLFAERGISGVSLREIGAAAGQRNNSAAQYHFDTKQGLVNAIYEYRMQTVNERRRILVDQIERDGTTSDLRVLLAALVEPVAQMIGPESYYGRFQAQVWAVATQTQLYAFKLSGMDAVQRLSPWLNAYVADLPASVRTERLMLMGRFMIFALADYERDMHAQHVQLPMPALVANLVDMMAAMVQAPVSPAAGELQGVDRSI